MLIPQTALSSEALEGVIKEFFLREGTEYGEREVSLETKVKQVRRQLERGEVVVVYDEESESVDIVSKNSARYKSLVAPASASENHDSGDKANNQ